LPLLSFSLSYYFILCSLSYSLFFPPIHYYTSLILMVFPLLAFERGEKSVLLPSQEVFRKSRV
jgi:hypothetical protein